MKEWKLNHLGKLVLSSLLAGMVCNNALADRFENDDFMFRDEPNLTKAVPRPKAKQKPISIPSEVFYRGRLTAGPFYDTDVRYFGLYDLFMPYTFNPDNILFLDGRYRQNHGATFETNWGLGFRHIFEHSQTLFGMYSFWDHRDSSYGNPFNQMTIGAEFKSVRWSLMTNGYIPVGQKDYNTDALDYAALVPAGAFSNIVFRRGVEKAMYGGDMLLGYLVPHTYGLGAYLGGFVYARNGVKTAAGPIVHMEYTIQRDHYKRILGILSKIHLVADYQHDQVRGNTWFAGARFDVLFGHQPELCGIQRRMQDFIRRDLNILSEPNTEAPTTTLLNPDGSPVTVAQISVPFTTSAANVIGVTGSINNAATTVALTSGQDISGGDYPFYGDGHLYHVQVGNNGSISSADATTITYPTASTGNTIENLSLTLTGTTVPTANVIGASLVTNQNSNLIIRNNTMLNSTTVGGAQSINVGVAFGAGQSSASITNNTLIQDQAVGTSFNLFVYVDGAANNTNTISIEGNTMSNVNTTNPAGNITIEAFSATATLNVTGIISNSLTAARTNLEIFNGNSGTINVSGPISNNTMAANGNASAFTINAGNGAATAATVNVTGGITNNTINGGTVTADIPVVFFNANGTVNGNTLNISSGFNNNTVTVNNGSGGGLTGVIQVAQTAAQNDVSITGFNNNTITISAGTQSPGIDLNSGFAGGSITVNVNDGSNSLNAANSLTGANATTSTATGTLTVNPSIN